MKNTISRARRPAGRQYTTADVARWFDVSKDEVRAWIRAWARQTPRGWFVVLRQMVGYRRTEHHAWTFRMLDDSSRRGTSRPPTAERRRRSRK